MSGLAERMVRVDEGPVMSVGWSALVWWMRDR